MGAYIQNTLPGYGHFSFNQAWTTRDLTPKLHRHVNFTRKICLLYNPIKNKIHSTSAFASLHIQKKAVKGTFYFQRNRIVKRVQHDKKRESESRERESVCAYGLSVCVCVQERKRERETCQKYFYMRFFLLFVDNLKLGVIEFSCFS